MKDNVYLVFHKNYTYSVYFATEAPNSNAFETAISNNF